MRIAPEDSADLGFVVACLLSGAIDTAELRAWSCRAIAACHDPPHYLFDLLEFDRAAFHIYDAIGFMPEEPAFPWRAVSGIAAARGRPIDETVVHRDTALEALRASPEARAAFRRAFPDVPLPAA